MSSESFNPSPPWGLCDFRVSQFCDPTLVCHPLLDMWFWASYWTSLSLIFILCTHCWKFETLTSPHSIPDPHDTQAEDFGEFYFKCCFPIILASGVYLNQLLGWVWRISHCCSGQRERWRESEDRYNVDAALCCCELGIDLRKAGEPWLQSSHITGSREKSVYLSESDGTDGEVKGRLITRWLKKVWVGLGISCYSCAWAGNGYQKLLRPTSIRVNSLPTMAAKEGYPTGSTALSRGVQLLTPQGE